MNELSEKEEIFFKKLKEIAGHKGFTTGKELLEHSFADFAVTVFEANVSYPQSLQSRKLQILRKKGYITMERKNGGIYKILK